MAIALSPSSLLRWPLLPLEGPATLTLTLKKMYPQVSLVFENISTSVTEPTESMCLSMCFLITKLFKKCFPHLSQCNFKCSYIMEERVLQNQQNFCDYPCANDMKIIVCFLIAKLFQKYFSHNSPCTFKLSNSMWITH